MVHLKGYSFALNRKIHFQCLGPKNIVLFYVTCAAKNSEACCDVALLLLVVVWGINSYTWRCATGHMAQTSDTATTAVSTSGVSLLIWKNILYFFPYVAKHHVLLQLRWRHLAYCLMAVAQCHNALLSFWHHTSRKITPCFLGPKCWKCFFI